MSKIDDIDQRLKRLEDRCKVNFLRIEKRFSETPQENNEELLERLKQLEDLQMYLELENIKIKEKINESNLLSSESPDLEKRIVELEKKPSSKKTGPPLPDLKNKIDSLEEDIADIKKRISKKPEDKKKEITKKINQASKLNKELDKKLRKVEELKKYLTAVSKRKGTSNDEKQIQKIEKRLDVIENKLKKDISEFEEMVEHKAMKYLSENLENFAKTVDKKIGQIPEQKKLGNNKNKELEKIKLRLNSLERRFSEISRRVGSHSSPVVIE